jgi:hypothetical protein
MLLAAKGNGCSTEVQPGDGSAAEWDFGSIPSAAGPDQPMTCAWLEGDNCWKRLAQAAADCAPEAQGTFSEERDQCAYDDGAVLDLEGPISQPASNITHYPIVNHRLLAADGTTCFAAKVLGLGRTAYRAGAQTVVLESETLTQYRVICQDGSSFANAGGGACADIGALWLARRTPGYVLSCDGGTEVCTSTLWGASATGSPEDLQTCASP